jgi:hypothetical protein
MSVDPPWDQMKADAALIRHFPDIIAKMSCTAVDDHMGLVHARILR